MTAQLAPAPVFRSWDNLGLPLVGGKLNTYIAGTTTPQATYTDSTQGTPNTNPVILNFRGEAFVWLDPTLTYKFVLTDAFGNLIWTEDNIPGNGATTSGSIIPTTDNTFTLGNPSFSWANIYLGPNHAPALDSVSGNIGYYARTAAEIAAGVTPTNYVYLPGDFRRYGADPTAITSGGTFNASAADSTAAILAAFSTGQTVLGGGRNCGYKCSQSIPLTTNTDFDAQDCTIYWTADVAGFTNVTGAAVLYPNIRGRLRAKSNVVSTHAMLDLVDVNRGYFDIAQADRGVTLMSWGYAVRIRTSVSTSLWNKFMPMEVNTVNTGGISIENTNCNQNIFFGFKLLNDAAILLPFGVKITGGGDNYFFDLDLEASFSTNGAGNAYGINFNTGSQNRVFGLRTEGYSNSASFYGVNYAGGANSNEVWGHYFLGFGVVGPPFNGLVAGNTYVAGSYNYVASGSLTGLKGEIGWDSVGDRFKATTNAGGTRFVLQSPALDLQDCNGNPINNIGGLSLNAAASSPGSGKVALGSSTATTVGAAGGATALPATPLGYLIAFVGTTQVKIPYFNP